MQSYPPYPTPCPEASYLVQNLSQMRLYDADDTSQELCSIDHRLQPWCRAAAVNHRIGWKYNGSQSRYRILHWKASWESSQAREGSTSPQPAAGGGQRTGVWSIRVGAPPSPSDSLQQANRFSLWEGIAMLGRELKRFWLRRNSSVGCQGVKTLVRGNKMFLNSLHNCWIQSKCRRKWDKSDWTYKQKAPSKLIHPNNVKSQANASHKWASVLAL